MHFKLTSWTAGQASDTMLYIPAVYNIILQ